MASVKPVKSCSASLDEKVLEAIGITKITVNLFLCSNIFSSKCNKYVGKTELYIV